MLAYQNGRLMCSKHVRHDGMEGAQPVGVSGAWRERDVHRCALCSAPANLTGKARPREEVRRSLVQADRHHPWLVVKDRLYAVAVMDVYVDVAHSLTAVVEQPTNGDGDIVVDAEAAGVARHCVMQAAA